MTKKAIILAGGTGTRLFPATRALSKQLMPVYDKPMIYYPLSTIMLAGIQDILIISTPRDLPLFQELLGDGSQWGLSLSYAPQPQQNGLAEAFIIGESFINGDKVALILGDNLFYGQGLEELLRQGATNSKGSSVFAYRVANPQSYGVIKYDAHKQPVDFIEKPKNPPSSWVLTGLYFYDQQVVDIAKSLKPSPRGELEITDINKIYLTKKQIEVMRLGRGYAWLDTGTHDSLASATEFVRLIEARQNIKIGCPEEIAFKRGLIDAEQVLKIAHESGETPYASYLKRLIESE
ncbi:MAG: glucose-1-phosphate thymidylyltransferase RfbA [Alphaproteobacteria bacterium]|jgi:glucose-1-phosphate thymidylyltransferase|nr:glucose-1-phosphate thymidylyltransferase RfbA [Alphaproteobacteria bacterium]